MATKRGAALVGCTGLAAGPGAAWSSTATGTTSGLLVLGAVVVGAALAVGAGILFLRARDRRAATPLQQTLTVATAAWWRCDADGRIAAVEAGRLPGTEHAQRLAGRVLWEAAGGGDAADTVRAAFADRRPFTEILFAASGAEAPALLLTGGPLYAPTGAFTGYAGTLTQAPGGIARADETDRLRAELSACAQRLADRTVEFEHAARELDSFAYSVSHDLRAPLRVVDGFANILLEDYGDRGKALDDVGRDHLRRIVAASQRMNTMIDTLLGLSRMTAKELNRERVDLSQAARELIDDLRGEDPARQVEVRVTPGLRVDGDPTLLRLVLQNLIGNAFKFTSKNRSARIEFGARSDGAGLAYYVKDNGAGFDMRFAEKMFGLFQRLHSANEFPGTGVGLATVQKIVRRHGGRVWAEAIPAPDEGHGATFYFTLWERP